MTADDLLVIITDALGLDRAKLTRLSLTFEHHQPLKVETRMEYLPAQDPLTDQDTDHV